MNRENLDRWMERGILGLVLAVLIFAPLATGAVRPVEFLVVQALAIGIGILWLIRLWLSPQVKIFWPPISWAVSVFVLYAIIRYFSADIEFVARQEMLRVLIYALIFFAITNNLNRAEPAQIISITLIILASGLAAYGAFQFLTKSEYVWSFSRPIQYLSRGSGTFINPNHFSGFLEMILPLAIAYPLIGRFKHVSRIFLGYAALLILIGIGFSASRGGWAATGIVLLGMVVMLFKQSGSRLKAIAVFALLLCVGFVFLNTSWFQRRIDQSYTSGKFEDLRPLFWESAISLWKEEPWMGIGPGHFDQRYGKFRQAHWSVQMRPQYVHNDYLNTLVDWGIIGVSIVLGALFLLAIGFGQTWHHLQRPQNDLNHRRSNREALMQGAIFGVFAMLLHSVVDFNLQIPANAILFVTLTALVTGFRRYEPAGFSSSNNMVRLGFTLLLLLPAILYLSLQAISRFEEQKWLRQAHRLKNNPVECLAAFKKAHEAEPQNFETTYAIGELLRVQSWIGNETYREDAREAMHWFERGMRLNRYFPYNYMRYGMCLDWLGKHEKAKPFFDKALELDPNSYFLTAFMGWHFMQVEDYTHAKEWFERSLVLYDNWQNRNPMPVLYLDIIHRRLTETDEEPVLDIPPKN